MEDIQYTPINRSTIIANHQYTHAPYPIICNNNNTDIVTYIDLLGFGSISHFGFYDQDKGLNPATNITTWKDFVIVIDKHLRQLNDRILYLESLLSHISVNPSGTQNWTGTKIQDTFTATTSVLWSLTGTHSNQFSLSAYQGAQTIVSFTGSTPTSEGTLSISTNKNSYTVGETATITMRFTPRSATTYTTTLKANSTTGNDSVSVIINKIFAAGTCSSVTYVAPNGSTSTKPLSNNSATATYSCSSAGTYTFKVQASGMNEASCQITVSQGTPDPTDTYYWYVGQTDPNNINSIGTLATDYISGGGWYELGTSVPNTISQLVKGGDADKYWYVMVPVTSGTTLKPVTSDMTTLDTSVSTLSTKVYNGVTYQIYWYGGATGSRNTFRFAKK